MAEIEQNTLKRLLLRIVGGLEQSFATMVSDVGKLRSSGVSDDVIKGRITNDTRSGAGWLRNLMGTIRDTGESIQQSTYVETQMNTIKRGSEDILIKKPTIVRETEKARLVNVHVEDQRLGKRVRRDVWFPKSQTSIIKNGDLLIKQWLIRKKNEEIAESIRGPAGRFDPIEIVHDGIFEGELPGKPVSPSFMWNAVLSNTCVDCVGRHGDIRTLDEWRSVGLPGQGATVCRHNCRCTLLPVDTARELYEVETNSDLTKRAQSVFEKKRAEIKAEEKRRGKPFAESTFMAKLGQAREFGASSVPSGFTSVLNVDAKRRAAREELKLLKKSVDSV